MRISDWSSDVCSSDLQPPPKTASEWRTYIRRFTEVSGDFPVSAITKAHVRDFKDALLLLPRSLTAPQRALTVPEVLEEIADEDIPRLSTGAVKKALGALRSVLTWAVENGYCENNPASGIKVRDPKRSEEHTSELQSLMRISYAVFCLKK